MLRPKWFSSLFSCVGPPPTVNQTLAPPLRQKVVEILPIYTAGELLAVFPILWSYLSGPERKHVRACCQKSRRLHDTLVQQICICDDAQVLSGVPASRLPRSLLPICHETTLDVARTLHGLIERGCQPQVLFLSLVEGHERRRFEDGLAILMSLAASPSHLCVIHLCGVPLTPQCCRVLKALLMPVAAAESPALPIPRIAAVSTPLPLPAALPSLSSVPNAMLSTTSILPSPRTLTAVSVPPPPQPRRLSLYGYDLSRQPAADAIDWLLDTAAVPLTRLELWGCVGWPKRMSALLHRCNHLRQMTVSFQQLTSAADCARGSYVPSTVKEAMSASLQRAVASGAVAAFPPIAAAATVASVVKTIGGLHHLRSLELRGCIFNMTRHTSTNAAGGGGAIGKPSRGAAAKAAAERAAVAAAAPTTQQLACALYTLTNLTRLAVDGLKSASLLLTALTAMRGLRQLELPDAAAPTAAELAAIARAAPQLVALTLGSVGPGSVLDGSVRTGGGFAAAMVAPEVLPLPPALAVLRVVRVRPTLRTMRSLQRTVEAKAASAAATTSASSGRMSVVVPGIQMDMLDMEFDALQGFSRSSDGVMRSTLLSDSAVALTAAIRLIAQPQQLPGSPSLLLPESPVRGSAYTVPSGVPGPSLGDGASRPSLTECARPAFPGGSPPPSSVGLGAVSVSSASYPASFTRYGRGSGGAATVAGDGGDPGSNEVDWEPAFGFATITHLTIHNAQGSLCAPHQDEEQPLPPAGAAVLLEPAAVVPTADEPRVGASIVSGDVEQTDVSCVVQPKLMQQEQSALVGHAVWITEMLPLGLRSLELYGIGVRAGDLEALAKLSTLERLTLASGELEVNWLPCLAALPLLEYLDLARCTPCRNHGSGLTSTSTGFGRESGGVARASASAGADYSRVSVGAGGLVRESAAADRQVSNIGDGDTSRETRPSGKHALLELCMTAPRLRRVYVVRCTGIVCRTEGVEGPLGAEWVRQKLLTAGPRMKDAVATAGRVGLGRASKAVTMVTEADLDWPEIRWE